MKVYALVGESGSGKSYRALWLAEKYKIKYVIDDGLLIYKGKVLEGKSAKREKTKMGSVKCAIFFNDKEAEKMNKALKKHKVDKLLIVGTSNEMVDRIAQRIGAGPVYKYVNISDIATQEEIATAKQIRNTQGMHVIPVPTMAIKKDFQGYFLDKLEILIAKSKYKSEKTVMRPTYSYLGDYTVSRSVLYDICRYEAEKTEIVEISDMWITDIATGIVITLGIKVKGRYNLREICKKIRDRICTSLEGYVSITVEKVDITVRDISFE